MFWPPIKKHGIRITFKFHQCLFCFWVQVFQWGVSLPCTACDQNTLTIHYLMCVNVIKNQCIYNFRFSHSGKHEYTFMVMAFYTTKYAVVLCYEYVVVFLYTTLFLSSNFISGKQILTNFNTVIPTVRDTFENGGYNPLRFWTSGPKNSDFIHLM